MTDQIGRYLVRGLIGKGGFGAVYRAWDPARFRSEPATTGMLKHKNIITVYDFGEQDSSPYLVMELLTGSSLPEAIDQRTPLSLPEKAAILGEIARGLRSIRLVQRAGLIIRSEAVPGPMVRGSRIRNKDVPALNLLGARCGGN